LGPNHKTLKSNLYVHSVYFNDPIRCKVSQVVSSYEDSEPIFLQFFLPQKATWIGILNPPDSITKMILGEVSLVVRICYTRAATAVFTSVSIIH